MKPTMHTSILVGLYLDLGSLELEKGWGLKMMRPCVRTPHPILLPYFSLCLSTFPHFLRLSPSHSSSHFIYPFPTAESIGM